MNEAAILAARRNLKEISKEEIADALERIIAGELSVYQHHHKLVQSCSSSTALLGDCVLQ